MQYCRQLPPLVHVNSIKECETVATLSSFTRCDFVATSIFIIALPSPVVLFASLSVVHDAFAVLLAPQSLVLLFFLVSAWLFLSLPSSLAS